MLRRVLTGRPAPALLLVLVGLGGCNLQTVQREPAEAPAESVAIFNAVEDEDAFQAPTVFVKTATPVLPVQSAPPEPTLAWDRLRRDFRLPREQHPRVEAHLDWYRNNPAYIDRVFERAEPFLGWIVDQLEARDMPAELALLPVVESGFQPFAYSHGRAAGLWQFIPGTGKRFGLKQNWWYDGRRDVIDSTNAAIEYLEYLHNYFDGDWLLALAAYNSGEGTVSNAVKRNRRRGEPTDFWHLELPRETRDYVPKLIALRDIVADPEHFGITLPDMHPDAQIALVDTAGQIDLALAAELAGVEIADLYRLNPGFNRWATDPNGPHRLVVPADSAEDFAANLAEVPAEQRMTWDRHKVQPGETLSHIAKRFDTTVELLRSTNDLRGSTIRAGQHLLIPVARQELTAYSLSVVQRQQQRLESRTKDGARVYTVQSGDTLWDIARRNQLTVHKLARLNGMAPGDPLRPGRKLVVSDGGTRVASALPPSAVRQTIRYTVRKGDSLSRISQKFRVTVADLRKWNSLDRGQYLQPGQRLKLYVDVTRQADNS